MKTLIVGGKIFLIVFAVALLALILNTIIVGVGSLFGGVGGSLLMVIGVLGVFLLTIFLYGFLALKYKILK
jgi:hypothetical protein